MVGVTPFVDVVVGGVVGEGQPGLGAYCSCWMCLGATPLEDPLFAAWGVSALGVFRFQKIVKFIAYCSDSHDFGLDEFNGTIHFALRHRKLLPQSA